MTQRRLIRVTGPARSGRLAGLERSLVASGARLLTIRQHTSYGQMLLEALIELDDATALETKLHETLDALGLETQVMAIEADDYLERCAQAGRPQAILTLLAPRLTTGVLTAVEALIDAQGLNIDSLRQLSGPAPLAGEGDTGDACLEYRLRGAGVEIAALREKALALGGRLGVDIAVQEDTVWHRRRQLVCFDMDSTLIQAEVIDELARRHGVYAEVAAITERAMRGEIDFKQSFRQRMARLQGLDETVLAEIADELVLMDGTERLVAQLKRLGYRTAIVSGGFGYFARYLQQRLGFDEIHANDLPVADGRVTGEASEPIVDAERKAWLVQDIARRQGLVPQQVVAVGDGANDLKMLTFAGLGIAYRAKPVVRQAAQCSISTLGLDAVLYLMGHCREELEGTEETMPASR